MDIIVPIYILYLTIWNRVDINRYYLLSRLEHITNKKTAIVPID